MRKPVNDKILSPLVLLFSSTEYRLAEAAQDSHKHAGKKKRAWCEGGFQRRMENNGWRESGVAERKRAVERGWCGGALTFFLPSETLPAEAARASPIDFYF